MLAPICCEMLIDDRVAAVAGDEQRAIRRAGRHGAEVARRESVAPFLIMTGACAISLGVLPESRGERQMLQARFLESADRQDRCSAP